MKEFLDEIDRFISLVGMSESAFGIASVYDAKFIKNLRAGRRCWPETIARVRDYMRSVASQKASA